MEILHYFSITKNSTAHQKPLLILLDFRKLADRLEHIQQLTF